NSNAPLPHPLLPCSANNDEPVSLRARWVFPVWGPPLENGLVEITAGRISAIHDLPGPSTVDLGNAAIMPGLVNAHTHLQLRDVSSPLQPARPFTAWLNAVMAHRRGRSAEAYPGNSRAIAGGPASAVTRGLAESIRSGTTAIGDIAGSNWKSS